MLRHFDRLCVVSPSSTLLCTLSLTPSKHNPITRTQFHQIKLVHLTMLLLLPLLPLPKLWESHVACKTRASVSAMLAIKGALSIHTCMTKSKTPHRRNVVLTQALLDCVRKRFMARKGCSNKFKRHFKFVGNVSFHLGNSSLWEFFFWSGVIWLRNVRFLDRICTFCFEPVIFGYIL